MEKETKRKVIVGVSVGAAVLSLFGVACCLDETRQIKNIVAGSSERIREMSHVDIDKRMVDQMVRDSVKSQAGSVVRDAAQRVEHDTMADIRNRVKQAVQNQTERISKDVSAKLADEISGISRDDIIDEVVKEVTDKLVEKLSDDLDNEVGRIGKIFQGIAATLK